MANCLCSTIHQLAHGFDVQKADILVSDLNRHLAEIRSILSKSKTLSRDVRYQVTLNNQRTMKILSIHALKTTAVDELYDNFRDDTNGFWNASMNDPSHVDLRRRLACVIVFLRSQLNAKVLIPPSVAGLVQSSKLSELRYAGKKYLKMARKLGDVGSILWLPLEAPPSTYERYLNMDDEEVFHHLESLSLDVPNYSNFVQRLVLSQLRDPSISIPYLNLFTEYPDILSDADHVVLLIHALGGSEVPAALLRSVRNPQRRWDSEGEIQFTTAADFGLPIDLINLLSDDKRLTEGVDSQKITKHVLEDSTMTWSLHPDLLSYISESLSPQVSQALSIMALRLICFACPPCFEGNIEWSLQLKDAIWTILDRSTQQKHKIPAILKIPVTETLMYIAERDSYHVRRAAIDRARFFLDKTMPSYLHASVALFESIISRQGGSLPTAEQKIVSFLSHSQEPTTRLENAIRGRLHIAELENKIQSYDEDTASFVYRWEGWHPLSSMEIEVTRRLQGTATKFFQSIGDFQDARASMEQHLSLATSNPLRLSTRQLIVGKLADTYSELHEYEKSVEIIQPELQGITGSARGRRPHRRLLLALLEAKIGQYKLDDADTALEELVVVEPSSLDDINDQLLHMRRVLLVARLAHERLNYQEALQRWTFALERMQQLDPFRRRHKMTAAIIYSSMAHVHFRLGNLDACRQSWTDAAEVLNNERCEFWIPVLATTWLCKVITDIHQSQGWPMRMMLPGGKPDITWS